MPTITLSLPNRDAMTHKVNVIKAIRSLTSLGLRESKEISDDLGEGKPREITIRDNLEFNEEYFNVLRSNGIIVGRALQNNGYVRDVRNLTIRALKNGDYTVAQDVIELLKKLDPEGV